MPTTSRAVCGDVESLIAIAAFADTRNAMNKLFAHALEVGNDNVNESIFGSV